ncbi:hypothetical protein FRC14_007638 [Serendipita sp. 396]|nr:hypothetical protein FRC14_007638 [Serendipita sp. 396]KAG8777069.1 hypothetical protein FRC15_011553 [Serendipita sp. 397]KAG8815910.1 hypothetical protein FRC19_000684 [Serendipita sp. 401]KAG8857734.1 hypothetical protein FRC20_000219 [Serendipita sp. 405]KAG9046503.1 hypothetical protein FS842_000859 [Serendipita sp. 407]
MSDIKTINSALMGGPNDIPGGTGPGPGTGANPANPNNWTLFAPPSERTATEASEDGQEAWIYPPVGGDPSTFTRGEGVVEVDDENTHSNDEMIWIVRATRTGPTGVDWAYSVDSG